MNTKGAIYNWDVIHNKDVIYNRDVTNNKDASNSAGTRNRRDPATEIAGTLAAGKTPSTGPATAGFVSNSRDASNNKPRQRQNTYLKW